MLSWCERLELEIAKIKAMEKEGKPISDSIAARLSDYYHACKILKNHDEWTDYNEKYRGAVYPDPTHTGNAGHSNGVTVITSNDPISKEIQIGNKYSHSVGHNACEIDMEMERIIALNQKEAMEKLSAVLSEHFKDLMHINPKMYVSMLEKMKSIKY